MTTKTSARKKTAPAKTAKKSTTQPAAKSTTQAAKKSAPKAAAVPSAEDGRADFAALSAEYKKLPKDQVVVPRLDVQAAITHALGIAQRLQAPALRKRFLTLAEAGLPPAVLDQLAPAARAARYAFLGLSTTAATTQTAKVSLAVVQDATALRAEMLTVCDYHLGDQPAYAAELSAIRQGQGYQDLANDLDRLATLYAKEEAIVQTDTKHYAAGDDARAKKLAAQILAEVAASDPTASADDKGGKVPAARNAANRAFAFLALVYDEVAAAGRYLLRHEGGDEIFCSLYTAGRKRRKATRPAPKTPAAT